ncbi:MAG: metal ABC transporter permease [Pirellulales bacterium]|nr:metal ABC transporter permease [Pirellulales bacterium]
MVDFLEALNDPAVAFLRYALLAGLLASVSLGVVGSYVVVRRITYLAAAIAHCVLGGVGAAVYLQQTQQWAWCNPMFGATAAALLAALVIGLVSLYAREREDTVIGAVWVVGMSIGLLFFYKTPRFVDPMSYLFGNILLVSARDVWMVAAMGAAVAAFGLGFYNKLLAVCFDEEFAALRGVRARLYYLLLLCLTAVAVVLMVRVVGIVLVIALVTLPAAVAGHFAQRLWQMMILAVLCSMACVFAGLAISYPTDLRPGPTIVLIAGAAYLLTAILARLRTTV